MTLVHPELTGAGPWREVSCTKQSCPRHWSRQVTRRSVTSVTRNVCDEAALSASGAGVRPRPGLPPRPLPLPAARHHGLHHLTIILSSLGDLLLLRGPGGPGPPHQRHGVRPKGAQGAGGGRGRGRRARVPLALRPAQQPRQGGAILS